MKRGKPVGYTYCVRKRPGCRKKVHRWVRLEVCNMRSQISRETDKVPDPDGKLWDRCEGCTDWMEDLPPQSVVPCVCGTPVVVVGSVTSCPVCKRTVEKDVLW